VVGTSMDSIANCNKNQQSERASSGDMHQDFNCKGVASGLGFTDPHLRAEAGDQSDSDVTSMSPADDNQYIDNEGRPDTGAFRRAEDNSACDDRTATAVKDVAEAKKTENRISCPYKTRQELHVTYNVEHARYEGLPVAWRALNVQFGLPLEAMPKRAVDGYEGKIPAVLQMMKEYLFACGGGNVEGIFRLAPDREECAATKRAINNGTFSGCGDVNVVANLIKVSGEECGVSDLETNTKNVNTSVKVWFRELPRGIFNMIPEKYIYSVCELTVGRSDSHFMMNHVVLTLLSWSRCRTTYASSSRSAFSRCCIAASCCGCWI